MFSVYTTAKVTLFGGKTAKCREKFVSSRPKHDKTILGKKTDYRSDYAPEVLETFLNKHPENDYWVRFNCPEFTSLCPITGQPDFAEIRISYIPAERMVESKSLKLYLFSFRNHGDFHEDCVNIIILLPGAVSVFILTPTMEGLAPDTNNWPGNVSLVTSDWPFPFRLAYQVLHSMSQFFFVDAFNWRGACPFC